MNDAPPPGQAWPAFSTLPGLLNARAGLSPDAEAILAPGRRPLTYRGLDAHAQRVARQLAGLGIGRGDRVATVLDNGPEMATAFLAIASVATCAPLNPAYGEREFDFYLGDLDARALVVAAGSSSPALAVARARGIAILELHPSTDA